MRVAIAFSYRRKIGGVETYLSSIAPSLVSAGHKLAFWHEVEGPSDRDRILVPQGAPTWCVEDLGAERALAALRDWRPDLIYAHGLLNPELEAQVLEVAATVFFAHGYFGTCISGVKTFKFPTVIPCQRQFGPPCLLHYFPRRCGGYNPITMFKLYWLQARRLELLHRYDAIATHSEHMQAELVRHGLEAQRVYSFPYYVKPVDGQDNNQPENRAERIPASPATPSHWQLLFSGRMEFLKGGHVFLQALPQILATLDRPLRVTFAGDGRERARLEQRAALLCRQHSSLKIEFTGWLDHEVIELLLAHCDLLVVPSLWPEPFGLVGPEAGLRGVPVAAFAVGGITDWLQDGVNGALAPGEPPTASGLAEAVIRCLRDPIRHAQMRRDTVAIARQFNVKDHLASLMKIFEHAIEHRHRCSTHSV